VNGAGAAPLFASATLVVLAGGCGSRLDVGSDVLWSASFESGTFDEWTADNAGAAEAYPTPPNLVEVTTERVRGGRYAAKLTVDAPAGSAHGSSVLARTGDPLPTAGYYSAWYYLPRSITVGDYWVILKFREQDQSTVNELFDLDLSNLDSGEMSLQLYDHRRQALLPLDVASPVVPVGQWFQIEAFYRNAQDNTGRLTFWLDGRQIVDIANQPMAPTPWVEWYACSVAENLTPSTAVLYVDDCAVSRTRVGPTGMIAN
jgi:hypothetical protein